MNDLSPGRSGPTHVITIQVGDPDLNFRPISVPHAAPTGRQILEAAGVHPIDDYVALALLPNGDTEALRLDEHLDLRGRGVGRIILFKTDRLFRLEVDRREKEWGLATISGRALKFLAGVDPAKYDVYQETQGNDPLIPDNGFANLSGPGVERFYTIISETTEGLASLPPEDHAYLEGRHITYEVVKDGAEAGLVLRGIVLPSGKFDHAAADILVIRPEVTERPSGTHKREAQRQVAAISNHNKGLQIAGRCTDIVWLSI